MMDKAIIYPIFILAFWTFLVLILIPIVRIGAVRKNQARREDFKFGESESLPDYVKLPNRNYMNLLELPILFYVICLIIAQTPNYPQILVTLAYFYVGFRIAHSLVHISANIIMLRLALFAISNFILLAMWIIELLAFMK